MIGSRAWFALMRRNVIYRKRYFLTTILELVLPILATWALIAIKNAADSGDLEAELIGPTIPNEYNETFQPLTFNDYLTALQAKRICEVTPEEPTTPYTDKEPFTITGYNTGGFNWQVPLMKCDSRMCDKAGQDASNSLCEYNIVGVAGDSSRVSKFMTWLEEKYPVLLQNELFPFKHDLVKKFQFSEEMDEYIKSPNYGKYPEFPKLAMGIVFNGSDPNVYDYSLRQNSTNINSPESDGRPATSTTPDTKKVIDAFAKDDESVCVPIGGTPEQGPLGLSCTGQYLYNGVLTFQRLVDDFIIDDSGASDASGSFVSEASVQYVPFPSRAYRDSGFYATLGEFGPLIIGLGFLWPVAIMISYIVQEKELRQKELMKMMSVSESDIGWSWFMTFLCNGIITAILLALVTDALYEETGYMILLVFWIVVEITFILFCMTIAAATSKTIRGVLIGVLLFFIGAFIPVAVSLENGSAGSLFLISLHPVAAMTYGLSQIGLLEDSGVGLTSDTISLSTGTGSGYTFQNTLSSMVIDLLLWGFLTWYLNRIVKPEYGQAYPLYFPFSSSYWFPSNNKGDGGSSAQSATVAAGIPYEPVGEALQRQATEGTSIEIHNLRKEFGEKTAVDGMSLSMYSGQITALLGHNGAGKTTTIAMLTGAIPPTSGYAVVAGNDIRYQMNEIRKDIGICLQHDCLFPMLTVKEHVQFFSRLKGLYDQVSALEADVQIDQVIRDVALFEKRNTYSMSLSGGMKRKLSVAMAFCGGSKVVLLDEPTSGMDPFSRRFTWNVIRQYRQGRCIILTTHFMDEADILGDRIAIMAAGQLRCAGSSLFLKKHYGVGYQLTIEKTQETHIQAKYAGEVSNGFKAILSENIDKELQDIVKGSVPSATLLNSTGSEIRYQLPMEAASDFTPMFIGLDTQSGIGTIQSYGVGMTTLDEVFLLVAREDHHTDEKRAYASSRKLMTDEEEADADDRTKSDRSATSRMDLQAESLFFRHVSALTRKRAANFSRDKKAWCCTTLVPTIAVLFGLLVVTFISPQRNLDPIALNIDELNKDVVNPPRHPVAYNSPDNPFLCQPGNCAYQPPIILSENTSEVYGFCGYTSRSLNFDAPNWTNVNSCSIAVSTDIMNSIGSGITPQPMDDVSTINSTSTSLLGTSNVFEASQYGAILFTNDPASVISQTGALFNETAISNCLAVSNISNYSNPEECARRYGGLGFVIQYNFTALHVSPMFQALADQAIVRQATKNEDFKIKVTIAPLPITTLEESYGKADDSFYLFLLVVLSFPIIAGAFGSFIVVERESKAKHLQTVAGVQPAAYWISSFIWDTMNYQIPLWLTIILFFIFDLDTLTTSDRNVFSAIVTVLFLYGPAAASYTYCLTYAFSSPSVCTTVSIISGFLFGFGGPVGLFIMKLIALDPSVRNESLDRNADILRWALSWNPTFLLGRSIFFTLNMDTIGSIEGDPTINAWSEDIVFYDVILLSLQAVVYLLLAIQLDYWSTNPAMMKIWKSFFNVLCCRFLQSPEPDIQYTTPEDTDVVSEEERIVSGGANSDLIVISQMSKRYDNGKMAVNNLSLGIPPGQCFGLLGINGAGKTTTMAILTAEFPPTSGDATLAGFSVSREPQKTRRRIGYCPQFDAHFANMSGREHVELYASIKGVPRESVKEAAAEKLREVGLNDFDADRLCSNYSGGMKRRLSIAIATIGSPQIVFLDECSTGVDPVARREIWELVSAMVSNDAVPRAERTSVILTTHSMEECEALCPRIGIMANGKLRCLGSAQHLKDKFGQGYQVELKTHVVSKDDQDYVQIIETLARSKNSSADDATVTFSLSEAHHALKTLTNDSFLSDMVTSENELGYTTWRDANSPTGVSLESLAGFAANELRVRNVDVFLQERFPDHVLRERQDNKKRYEVSTNMTRISDIFGSIEANKGRLWLADYGVSQTSLEQVFNMHAAEAESLKQGRNDR